MLLSVPAGYIRSSESEEFSQHERHILGVSDFFVSFSQIKRPEHNLKFLRFLSLKYERLETFPSCYFGKKHETRDF